MFPCPPQIKNNPIYYPVWQKCWNFDQNFFICFVGGLGKGKSFSAIEFLWQVCRDPQGNSIFGIDDIVFTAKDFINKVKDPKMTKGHGILWDEPQTEAGAKSRMSMSYQNRVISDVADTCRERRLIVAYALPAISLIDKNVRHHFSASVEMQNPGIGFFKWWEVSPITGHIYRKIPTIIDKFGVLHKKGTLNFDYPDKSIVKEYRKRKREKTNLWYGQYADRLDKKDSQKENTFFNSIAKIKTDWEKYWMPESKKVNGFQLESDYPDCTPSQIGHLRAIISEEGIKRHRLERERIKLEKAEPDRGREFVDAEKWLEEKKNV